MEESHWGPQAHPCPSWGTEVCPGPRLLLLPTGSSWGLLYLDTRCGAIPTSSPQPKCGRVQDCHREGGDPGTGVSPAGDPVEQGWSMRWVALDWPPGTGRTRHKPHTWGRTRQRVVHQLGGHGTGQGGLGCRTKGTPCGLLEPFWGWRLAGVGSWASEEEEHRGDRPAWAGTGRPQGSGKTLAGPTAPGYETGLAPLLEHLAWALF